MQGQHQDQVRAGLEKLNLVTPGHSGCHLVTPGHNGFPHLQEKVSEVQVRPLPQRRHGPRDGTQLRAEAVQVQELPQEEDAQGD